MPPFQSFHPVFPGSRGAAALSGPEQGPGPGGPFTIVLSGVSGTMDFAAGMLQGQWRLSIVEAGMVVWTDLPTATFVGLGAGTYTATIQAYNDTETIALGPLVSVIFTIPQPDAPDPDVFKHTIITDYYNARGQVRFLMWAQVPASLQSQFAVPGKASAWQFATSAENAAIAAGEVAELEGSISRGEKSDGEVRAALDARWEKYNATIQDAEALNQENTFSVGSGLWLRL